jgi:hypothetical protein
MPAALGKALIRSANERDNSAYCSQQREHHSHDDGRKAFVNVSKKPGEGADGNRGENREQYEEARDHGSLETCEKT